jgi:uncharacterized protein (TIGR02147 family)
MKKNRLSTPIFVYEDHVDFIRDWYSYAKRFGFTQREFLKRAGINANAFLSDIISQRKKIGRSHVAGFIKALELHGDEKEYFRLLAQKEQCRKPADKTPIFESLAKLRKNNLSTMLENRAMEYFTSWRYPVIREYIVCKGQVSSPKEIVNALINLKLSTYEVKQTLAKLVKWGMIVHDKAAGLYRPVEKGAISYQDMPHPVVNDVKRTLIEASVHAMEEMPKNERHVSMTIKGISKESYDDLCVKIDALRKEFLDRDDQEESADRIVSLNIQLFPVMKIGRSGGERGKNNE